MAGRAAPWVLPSAADPLGRAAQPLLGGPIGRRAAIGGSWWTPVRVCIVAGMLTYALGWLSKGYCVTHGWAAPQRYMYLCYSDIPILRGSRGLSEGTFPYLLDPEAGQQVLEYPVLTGVYMYLSSLVVRMFDGGDLAFFAVSVAGMAAMFAWTISSTCATVRRRPWDGLLVALAPAVALAGFVNWDLIAVAFTAACLGAWSRQRPWLAGVWLGLAAAAKFYPLVLLLPFAVLCLRRQRLPDLARLAGGTAGAWLVVNVPVMLMSWEGWLRFYAFSRERGMDFGSPWYALSLLGVPIDPDSVNLMAAGLFLLACAGIAWLGLRAPTPPRLAQLALLVVGAFVLTNKVYSPQYVLWVLPLAVLARPRWRDVLLWQLGEALYFVAIWWYLVGYGTSDKGLHWGGYVLAVGAHWLATAWLMGMVVRDILAPRHDVIRSDGLPEDADDPGGGVLDGAPARRWPAAGSGDPVVEESWGAVPVSSG